MKAAWWSNVKIVTQKKQASMKQISKPVFLRCGKITEVVRVCLKNAFRTPPRRQSGMNFGYVTVNGVNSNDLQCITDYKKKPVLYILMNR